MSRLVLETAIGPVLPLLLGKLRAARWDSAGATAEGTQDPAPDRAAGQGLATSDWRGSAQRNSGEPDLTLAAAGILGRPADSAGHPEAIESELSAARPMARENPASLQSQTLSDAPCPWGQPPGGSVFDVASKPMQQTPAGQAPKGLSRRGTGPQSTRTWAWGPSTIC